MGKEVTESVVATIEVPTEAAKEVEIKQEVGLVETRAKEMIISTDEEYEKAAEFGQQIKAKAKVVTDFFKPMKDSAYQAHKAGMRQGEDDAEASSGCREDPEKEHDGIFAGEGTQAEGTGSQAAKRS